MLEIICSGIAFVSVPPEQLIIGVIILDEAMTGFVGALIIPIPATVHTSLHTITAELKYFLPFEVDFNYLGTCFALPLAIIPDTCLPQIRRVASISIGAGSTILKTIRGPVGAFIGKAVIYPDANSLVLDDLALRLHVHRATDFTSLARPHTPVILDTIPSTFGSARCAILLAILSSCLRRCLKPFATTTSPLRAQLGLRDSQLLGLNPNVHFCVAICLVAEEVTTPKAFTDAPVFQNIAPFAFGNSCAIC